MSDIVNVLIEMGFSRERAELAVTYTNGNDVESTVAWLHSNEEPASSSIPPENVVKKANTEPQEAKSFKFKCDDCYKLFRTLTEIEFHAAKSGHSNFSELTEDKKTLTEDEMKEQLAKIDAKLKQRRLDREAREKQEKLEREKTRKRKQEETEIKKVIEQRKREKLEE